MNAPLDRFHPAVAAWFSRTFDAPTPAQERAWPALQSGQHVLVAAPTGSGKTFAAFLAAIDQLVREGLEGPLPDETRIVYVSPLKALSNDIQRNLDAPLEGIREELAVLRPARCGDSRRGAHRRHLAVRARGHAAPRAAHRRHDARIAVHPARLGVGPRHAVDLPHGDRR